MSQSPGTLGATSGSGTLAVAAAAGQLFSVMCSAECRTGPEGSVCGRRQDWASFPAGAQPALQGAGPVVATGLRALVESSVVKMRGAGGGILCSQEWRSREWRGSVAGQLGSGGEAGGSADGQELGEVWGAVLGGHEAGRRRRGGRRT